MGTAVSNSELAAALVHKTDFTVEEYDAFRVPRLAFDNYVKVGGRYFRPVGAGERQEYLRQRGEVVVENSSVRREESAKNASMGQATQAVHQPEETRRPLAETLDAQLTISVLEKVSASSVGLEGEREGGGGTNIAEEKARFVSERGEGVRDGARSNPAF